MADQNEIKKLLDDPNVTPETKKQLVRALAGSGASEEDVNKYAKANGVEVPHDPGAGEHILGAVLAPVTLGFSVAENVDDEIQHGRFTMEGEEADKLVKKAGEERELGSTQKVLNENGPFNTSDELLDAGAPGLRFFEKFIPIYQKAAPICGHGGQAPDLKGYIYKNYDEVREIDFRMFREDARKIETVGKQLDDQQNGMTRAWGGLGAWEGDAANAARAYHDKYNAAATTFIESTQQAPGTINMCADNMQKKVKEFAQHIHDQYSEKCGNLTVEEAEETIRHANGDFFENDGGVLDWLVGVPAPVVGFFCGGGLPGFLLGLGWESWCGNAKDKMIKAAKDKLKALCQEFDQKKQAFDGYCQNVQKGIEGDYNALNAALQTQIPQEPFKSAGDPPPFEGEQGKKDGVKKPGGGGGGGGGGGPSGGGGGGGMPEMPKPENPLDKDGDGKPDVPGDTDGDGKPDDLDGDGKPDVPKPEKELETVTVKSGDNTIKITEPDSNGHVKMTIDTPKGEPKTYDLDFSKNPEAAKALMGQNGAAAIAGLASSVQGSQAPGAPAPNAPGTPGTAGGAGGTPTPGGGGAPGGAGGDGAAIPVEVGPDGKIHIEQDGINFTAEVNPDTGEINLTVDDGDGTPDQIGVEFGEDENTGGSAGGGVGTELPPLEPDTGLPDDAFPEPAPMPAPPDQPMPMPAPAPDEWTTMPAPGDNPWSQPVEGGGRGYIEDNGIMPNVGSSQPSFAPGVDSPQFATASDATTTSGVSMTGGGSSGSDSVLGGSSGSSSVGADSAWSSPGANAADSGSQFGTTTSEAGAPGSATLPSMDGAHGQAAPGGGAAMGGGMMGGGMMGGGAGAAGGGQQGGDTERGPSQWRTTGSLFDDDSALSRVQGVLGDDRGGR